VRAFVTAVSVFALVYRQASTKVQILTCEEPSRDTRDADMSTRAHCTCAPLASGERHDPPHWTQHTHTHTHRHVHAPLVTPPQVLIAHLDSLLPTKKQHTQASAESAPYSTTDPHGRQLPYTHSFESATHTHTPRHHTRQLPHKGKVSEAEWFAMRSATSTTMPLHPHPPPHALPHTLETRRQAKKQNGASLDFVDVLGLGAHLLYLLYLLYRYKRACLLV
jgi:hypothetical protein